MRKRTRLAVTITACMTAAVSVAGTTNASAYTVIKLKNGYSGKCLDGGIWPTDNTIVYQETCDGTVYEQWHWSGDALVSESSGLCLAVYGASKNDKADITEYTCNGSTGQAWTDILVHTDSGDAIALKNQNSGKCIVIYGASQNDGAYATQYTCNTADLADVWYR